MKKSLHGQTLANGLLLLSGCDVARRARDDLARLSTLSISSAPRQTSTAKTPTTRTSAAQPATASANATDPAKNGSDGQPKDVSPGQSVNLVGKSENELRALLGPPTKEEDRPPGKTWRYRDGQCTLDVQLYPDVQTRQFGTLGYEVKSDDNTDEGKRVCLAQLRSRT